MSGKRGPQGNAQNQMHILNQNYLFLASIQRDRYFVLASRWCCNIDPMKFCWRCFVRFVWILKIALRKFFSKMRFELSYQILKEGIISAKASTSECFLNELFKPIPLPVDFLEILKKCQTGEQLKT